METEPIKTSFWDFIDKEDYVDDWFLMGSPLPILFILASYLFFVLKWGPKHMEKRPPYKLKNTLLVYNVFQVLYACYMFNMGIRLMYITGFIENGICAKDDEDIKYRLLSSHHLYFLVKCSELLDTVFFVMRKKWNQVSFLHVYHHSNMFFFSWFSLKYANFYVLLFTGTINTFVHIIMYGYYALAAFPELEKYLWWKKYLTKFQIIQFGLIFLYSVLNQFISTCPVPRIFFLIGSFHAFAFIYLFTKFYYQNYYSQNRKQDGRRQENEGEKRSKLRYLLNRDKNEIKDKSL